MRGPGRRLRGISPGAGASTAPTGRNTRERLLAAALAAGAGALALAGCGLGSGGSQSPAQTPQQARTAAQERASYNRQQLLASERRFASLPKPVAGTVRVAEGSSLGITPHVISAYESANPGVTVEGISTSSAQAFHALCTGQADIAEATRTMSASELALCAQNGITFNTDSSGQPVPIELAADGIVIATRNESDVGGDCVTRPQLRAIFERGSTVDNWDQLSFYNLPLSTTGRDANTDAFQLFANLVLGTQGNATLQDVRSDYLVESSDDAVRYKVTGGAVRSRLLAEESAALASALKRAQGRIAAAENVAAARANRGVLYQIAQANRKLAASKVRLTAAQKNRIAAANLARDQAAKAAAARGARQQIVGQITQQVDGQYAAQLAATDAPGVAGVFRFTYYQLYEQQLRPLEVWDPVTTLAQLSQDGIASTGSVDEVVKTTLRQQAGGGAGLVTTITFPRTPTAPGSSYTTAGGGKVYVPRGGPVNLASTPNCIFPSQQTIDSGVYPLSARLLAYVPRYELRRAPVVSWLGYYLAQGQDVVVHYQLVPLETAVRSAEYRQLTGQSLPQSVLDNGSSPAGSVAPVGGGATAGAAPSATSTTATTSTTGAASTTPATSTTGAASTTPANPSGSSSASGSSTSAIPGVGG